MPKRDIALPSFLMCSAAVSLLAASLSTQHWIEATPYKIDETDNTTTHSTGKINFGFFLGYEDMQTGLITATPKVLNVVCSEGVCMYSNKKTAEERKKDLEETINYVESQQSDDETGPLLSQALWASAISFLCASICLGIVGGIFSIINAVMNPVEFITSIRGLHIWNALGGLFAALAQIVWGVAYSKSLQYTVLGKEDLERGWKSSGQATYGFSLWLVLVALILYFANSIFIILKTTKPWEKKAPKTSEANNRPAANIMLY